MYNLKTLLYLDFLKVKNMFLEIFKSPLQIIKKFLGILYFIGIGIFLMFGPIKDIKSPIKITNEVYTSAIGVIAILGTIIVVSILAFYLSNYTPSNFNISDIQYLFPSPLNNNVILFYSMIKSSIEGASAFFLMIFFVFFMAIMAFGISFLKMLSLLAGLFFIFLFFMSLAYLLFAIRVKYNLDKSFKLISHLFKIILCLFILLIVYAFWDNSFSLPYTLQKFGSGILLKIPIIGNITNTFSSLFNKSIYPQIYDKITFIILTFINIFSFFKLNINYYEYIAEKVEEKDQKIKEVLSSKDITLNTQIEKNMKKVNTSLISKDRFGVLALFWKNSTIRKRRTSNIKKYLVYDINLAISTGGAFATLKGYQRESIFAIAGITIYCTLIISSSSELGRELKSLYIFLIPGKPIFKILSSILDELITLFIRITLMLLPSMVLNITFLPLGILVYILTLLVCLFLKLQNLVSILLLPKEKTSPPMLYMLFIMIIVGVPVGVSILVFALTSNMYIGLLAALAIIICYIISISLLCEALFKKIQY